MTSSVKNTVASRLQRLDAHPKRVWLLLVGVFLIVGILTYFPVLRGRVPFAANVVTQFPPWESVPTTMKTPTHRPEYGDSVTLFYPWRHFQKSGMVDGEAPLWNPHILSGDPFLGDTESALFYPLNVAFYWISTPLAWTIKLILNVALAGLFTAWFVRSVGGSVPAAIAAGVAFALGGNMTTWQASNNMDAMLWLPLVFVGVHRLCSAPPDGKGFAITAIAFAMPVLAGHPETVAHLVIIGSAFAIWQSFGSAAPVEGVRRLFIFGAAGALAIGLSAIQLLPTLEWLFEINHTVDINWGTLRLHEFLAFVSRDITNNPNSSGLAVPESAAYAGGLTLLLVPLAFLHRSRREVVFLVIAIVAGLQIVYGGPVSWLIAHIPVLGGLKNWRFLVIIDFSLAVLAGLGMTAISENASKKPASRYVHIAPAIFFVLAFAGIVLLRVARTTDVDWLHNPRSSFAFLAVGYLLVVARTANRIRPKTFAIAAATLLSLDLMTYAHGYFPFSPRREIYPPAPLFTFLQQHDPSNGRIANLGGTYGPNFEMMYGLDAVGGYDVSLRRIKRFLSDVSAPTLDDVTVVAEKVVTAKDRTLDMLNARYFVCTTYNDSCDLLLKSPERFSSVYSEGHVGVFENRAALQRIFFVPQTQHAIAVIPDEDTQLERVKSPSFDPERQVILASMPAELAQSSVGDRDGNEPPAIEWTGRSSNRLQVNIETKQPGVLVLSQIFYPGWHAFVDQVEQPVLQVDYALTGVALKAGTRTVQFVFNPASYRIGKTLSILSMLAIAFILIRGRGKR